MAPVNNETYMMTILYLNISGWRRRRQGRIVLVFR